MLSLADFRGRVVLLNLWATWCVPCRKEMPALDRLQAKLGGDHFIIVPLSIDRGGAAAVKRFYHQVVVEQLDIYLDPSSRVPSVLGVPGVPTTLLIDGRGREVARKLGEAEWDGPPITGVIVTSSTRTPPDERSVEHRRDQLWRRRRLVPVAGGAEQCRMMPPRRHLSLSAASAPG